MTALAACLLVMSPAGAGAEAGAGFEPGATQASWDGNTVVVRFRETGLAPGADSTILIQATGVGRGQCVRDGVTLLTTQSSATATDVADYTADAGGTINGDRTLYVTVGVPVVSGLDCTMVVTRTISITLRDLRTGATYEMAGPAISGGPA
jgi:hypothetical protein